MSEESLEDVLDSIQRRRSNVQRNVLLGTLIPAALAVTLLSYTGYRTTGLLKTNEELLNSNEQISETNAELAVQIEEKTGVRNRLTIEIATLEKEKRDRRGNILVGYQEASGEVSFEENIKSLLKELGESNRQLEQVRRELAEEKERYSALFATYHEMTPNRSAKDELPLSNRVEIVARRTPLDDSERANYKPNIRVYEFWVSADEKTLGQISSVTYRMNHSSFDDVRTVRNRARGAEVRDGERLMAFRGYYNGYGCISNVTVELERTDGGETVNIDFDQCSEIPDEDWEH